MSNPFNDPLTPEELKTCSDILLKVLATENLDPFLEEIGKIFILAEFISFKLSLVAKRQEKELAQISSGSEITLEAEDDITKLRRVFAGYNFKEHNETS